MIVETVRKVLEQLDSSGSEADASGWGSALGSRFPELEEEYRKLIDPKRDPIDYSGTVTQAAYFHRYVAGHALLTCEVLKRVRALVGRPLFARSELRVSSLGGGPATELLGLLQYICEVGDEGVRKIQYRIFDKEAGWQHPAELLCSSVESEVAVELEFRQLDVTNVSECSKVDVSGDDLVILGFFISEVCVLPQSNDILSNIGGILSRMGASANLLYIDSDAYSFYSFMNRCAGRVRKLAQLVEVQDKIGADNIEMDGIFLEYLEEFGYGLKLSGKVVAKYFEKT